MPIEQPSCYGRMFPDVNHVSYNRTSTDGKAFAIEVTSRGIGVQARTVEVLADAWEACTACPAYRTCYDLSLGTLLLRSALAQQN